ncbi:hypothetical protein ANME2D_02461 [Candidatus Methanoperedens nitroreducens]|uniref:DNA recombination protein RmuC n=1 Tax=Candidatus Methanoperedens nitratireducens TaxID=1392998 RepID=A0A062V635_9EURY|nr:DNA recombination protein RmuC [Candidatus Methanoperedens nitroreducens]KCZ71259.1 hypothetical protein ANME2D_02461 [Candidatus Methanoperedens nitroreducens]MDJ1420313.1 DNA recombination protein RmuC [Candidatus Methanoperedens sp.]
MDIILIGIIAIVVLLGAILLLLYLQFRKPQGSINSSAATDIAVMMEKLSHLEPIIPAVSGVQTELKGLIERVSTIEQNQNTESQKIQALEIRLAESSTATNTATKNLIEATTAMHNEISQTKNSLTELQAHVKARQDVEQRTAESIKRLETIIAGTSTKGAAGENILEVVFAKLPPDWQVRNFKVGNKHVEFGLRLPNNLIVPIDSKWPATSQLEQLASCEDIDEQQELKTQIESVILNKAKEVKKYINPSLTVNFGIVAVPDAVYGMCNGIQADVFQQNIVLVSYSMFVPYLLLVFQTVLKTSQNIDLEKLDAHLQVAQASVKALQGELEGRYSKAIKLLNNSHIEMSAHLSKISSGLTNLQIGACTPQAQLAQPEEKYVTGSGET